MSLCAQVSTHLAVTGSKLSPFLKGTAPYPLISWRQTVPPLGCYKHTQSHLHSSQVISGVPLMLPRPELRTPQAPPGSKADVKGEEPLPHAIQGAQSNTITWAHHTWRYGITQALAFTHCSCPLSRKFTELLTKILKILPVQTLPRSSSVLPVPHCTHILPVPFALLKVCQR